VLGEAIPNDNEIAGRIRGDGQGSIGAEPPSSLGARGVCVDAELETERLAGAGEAVPDDDEVAGRVRGHDRTALAVRRVAVDAELSAEVCAGAGEALAEDA